MERRAHSVQKADARLSFTEETRSRFRRFLRRVRPLLFSAIFCSLLFPGQALLAQEKEPAPAPTAPAEPAFPLKVVGVTVSPHEHPRGIEFVSQADQPPGGRVQIFVRNAAHPDSNKPEDTVNINVLQINGNEPKRHVFNKVWAWEDTPADWPEGDTSLPPGALSVFSFNSLSPQWVAPESSFTMEFTDWINARKNSLDVKLPRTEARISSLCFLSGDRNSLRPDSLVFYLENLSRKNWKVSSVHIYQPYLKSSFRLLREIAKLERISTYPASGVLQPGQKMAAIVSPPSHLKLTTAVIEVSLVNPDNGSETLQLWEQLRVRRESFDVGAGWISASMENGSNILTSETWLKTLKFLHINTANIQNVPGYTDQTNAGGLYSLYPLKFMGTAQPLPQYDTDWTLPKFHAAESLGNVQDEINHCSPQDALDLLRVYGGFRIPTALILTDPWSWRHYSGISDYPHFNTSRLAIPNLFESWEHYTRWDRPIPWAAPLETMGILTRNLRDNNRPLSIAAWVQGPFDGWSSSGERKRLAPTPEELRHLAWQTLGARVSSLNWFNLNIGSLVQYRDLITPIRKVNREALTLEIFFLYGDSWQNRVQLTEGEKPRPSWELSSIICPRGALLCALDLDYELNRSGRVFEFRRPRESRFEFSLPLFLKSPLEVFRIDAEGTYDVAYQVTSEGVEITDKQSLAAIYIATRDKQLRPDLEKRRQYFAQEELEYKFDPAENRKDFNLLKSLAKQVGSIVPDEPLPGEEKNEAEANSFF